MNSLSLAKDKLVLSTLQYKSKINADNINNHKDADSTTNKNPIRTRKLLQKAFLQMEEAQENYANQLSSVDRFCEENSIEVQNQLQEKAFLNNFISFVSLFLADILVEVGRRKRLFSIKSSLKVKEISLNSMDICGGMLESEIKGERENYSTKFNPSLDMSFGALSSSDMLSCMMKWALDGSEDVNTFNIDKLKIMKAIKRMSKLVSNSKTA
jgi:hypothetical protein